MPRNGRPRWRRVLVAESGGPTMFARIGVMRANIVVSNGSSTVAEGPALGSAEAGEGSMNWGYLSGTRQTPFAFCERKWCDANFWY